MSCRVRNCRHPESHTTVAHRCGTCGEFGHGQMECHRIDLRENLRQFHGERVNFLRRCTVPNCPNPDTHSTTSHHCTKCNQLHQEDNCIIQDLETHRSRFQDDFVQFFNDMNFQNVHRNETAVVPIHLGMGCQLFVRIKDGEVTSLFMHSDSWGQYGPSQDLEVYNEYIRGAVMLEPNRYCDIPEPPPLPVDIINEIEEIGIEALNDRYIECPLCRTVNPESSISVAYGLEMQCSICLTNNVDLFFQVCGHACVCHECMEHL